MSRIHLAPYPFYTHSLCYNHTLQLLLQVVKESFIEDINSILNNGDVPGLFAPDERAALLGDMVGVAKKVRTNP